jgi:hypothetical protein
MKKPYVVYLSTSNNSYARDAYDWMRENNISENDVKAVISEKVFYSYLEDGCIGNHPVYFIKQAKYHRNV